MDGLQRARQWIRTLDPLGLATVIICYVVYLKIIQIDPDPLFIPPNDSEVRYPMAPKKTVMDKWLIQSIYIVSLLPIIFFKFLSWYAPNVVKPFKVFTCLWGVLCCLQLSNAISSLFKSFVGRARPDTYAVCGYNSTGATCNVTKKKVAVNQFLSWPSNHAAFSMSGTTYTTLFSQKVLRKPHSLVILMLMSFIIYGVYVGATRIKDYKHHPDDVLAGLFIGFVSALLIWKSDRKQIFRVEMEKPDSSSGALMDDMHEV